jgi:chitodextrinase
MTGNCSRGAQGGMGSRTDLPLRCITMAALLMLLTTGLIAPAQAEPLDLGTDPVTYEGFGYPSTVVAPTADKPQSKLWHHDGSWWALMISPSSSRIHVFELRRDHTWRDTGALVDERPSSTGDALWDGDRLYTGSRVKSGAALLNRFSYDPVRRTYISDPGFPVQIIPGGSESLTIAKDTTGRLWATFTQRAQVWVTHTATPGNDAVWSAAFRPPVAETDIDSDDISAVIAFDGKIGVMWSNQVTMKYLFTIHVDGDPPGRWSPTETALSGPNMGDDHINVKNIMADEHGRIYAAIKTSQGNNKEPAESPLLMLLVRSKGGAWDSFVHSTLRESMTRPVLVLDEDNRDLYFFASSSTSGGTIHYKVTSMDEPEFDPGRGAPFIRWPGAKINNATAAKHPVGRDTGLVVLASDDSTKRYYHAEMGLREPDLVPPTAPTTLTATAASSEQVNLTWGASTDDRGVAGYRVYRDGHMIGSTSRTSYADRPLTGATGFTYQVEAFDFGRNRSPRAGPVGVATPPETGGILLRGRTFGVNLSSKDLTIEVPAGVVAGDVLLASVDVNAKPTITPPAGWTLLLFDKNGSNHRKATYLRVADSHEPASYTWRLSAARVSAGTVVAYRGVDANNPVEAAAGQINARSSNVTAPSVTPSTRRARVVSMFGLGEATAVDPPPGMAELGIMPIEGPTAAVTTFAADLTAATAGPVGIQQASAAAEATSIGHTVALRPADLLPPTVPTGLTASALSWERVELSWGPSTDDFGVAGYRVYRDGKEIATTGRTTFTDRSVSGATSYAYEVEAFDGSGNRSGRAGPRSVMTPAEADGVVLRGRSFGANATATSLSVTRPVGVVAGDVLVASVDVDRKPTVTPPSGWTQVRRDDNNSLLRKVTYVRVAGADEPESYTWALSSSRAASGTVVAYRGVDVANPLEAVVGQINAASTSVTAPSVTTISPGARVVSFFGHGIATDMAAPPEMAELGGVSSTAGALTVTTFAADLVASAPGAVGSQRATAGVEAISVGHTVVLRPALR